MSSIYDEQIKKNKKDKLNNIENSFDVLKEAITGKSIFDSIDKNDAAKGAISLICKFFKIPIKDETYPREVETFEDRLEYRLKPHGIKYRFVHLSEDWYKNAINPLLGKIKNSEDDVILLLPDNFNRYYYYDLKTGEKKKADKHTLDLIESDVYAFYRPLPLKSISKMEFFKYCCSLFNSYDVLKIVLSTLFVVVLGIFVPKMSQLLLDEIVLSKSLSMLLSFSSMMIGVVAATLFIRIVRTFVINKLINKVKFNIQSATMLKVLSFSPSFFKEYSSGDISYRVSLMESLVVNLMNSIFEGGLMFIFSFLYFIGVSFVASSLLGPSFIISFVLIAFILIITILKIKDNQNLMKENAKENALTYTIMSGVEKIKLTGSEERAYNKWARQQAANARAMFSPNFLLKVETPFIQGITILGNILLFVVAKNKSIDPSSYYAFTLSYGLVSGSIMGLRDLALYFSNIQPTFDMVKPILETESEVSSSKNIVNRVRGNIELSNVSFKYEETGPKILDSLSFKIRAGEYVAIVGKSGCGKSTLIRLLLGFEKPNKGSIYYDSQDMNKLDLESLRKKIGVVTQDGSLIDDDIYHNIVASCPNLNIDEAWEAAEIAGLADDIDEMPMGMQTIISEDGGGISGGQKQRLLIARAIAPKPKILIFDEATSALDNVTQKQVSDALDELKCTRIVVAHRLSTIKHCDRIIVLDKGSIVEQGKYDDLIAKGGFFADLVKRQRLDVDDE